MHHTAANCVLLAGSIARTPAKLRMSVLQPSLLVSQRSFSASQPSCSVLQPSFSERATEHSLVLQPSFSVSQPSFAGALRATICKALLCKYPGVCSYLQPFYTAHPSRQASWRHQQHQIPSNPIAPIAPIAPIVPIAPIAPSTRGG